MDMPKTTNQELADTIEKVMTEVYGASAATATLRSDLGEGDYYFDASYEGELENERQMFVYINEMGSQAIWIRKRTNPNMVRLLYMIREGEPFYDVEQEVGEKALYDIEDYLPPSQIHEV